MREDSWVTISILGFSFMMHEYITQIAYSFTQQIFGEYLRVRIYPRTLEYNIALYAKPPAHVVFIFW